MYIYKVTNKINNMIYIGLTTKTIEQRFKGHIYHAMSKVKDKNSYFYNAIRKYGPTNFIIEKIEKCSSIIELKDRETFYITKFNTIYPNGYNLTLGGEGGSLHQTTKEKIRKKAKLQKVNWNAVKKLQDYAEKSKKPIIAYNIKTKNELFFNSIKETANFDFNKKQVSKVLNKKRKYYKGYVWRYANEPFQDLEAPKINPQIKKVKSINLLNNTIKFYNSVSETKKDGFNIPCVSMCCNKKMKRHKGFIFEFVMK